MFIFLIVTACGRPIELNEDDYRHLTFKVNPTFLCNSPSCIVNVYYKIEDNGGLSEASSKLELADPEGEISILKADLATLETIEYEAFVLGNDASVWTEGPGPYVFTLYAVGDHVSNTGETQISREVILFEDTHSIPHSTSITVDVHNQVEIKETVGIGQIVAEGEKFDRFYEVCSKGLVLTGITYDEPLSVFQSNADFPKKLEIVGSRINGNSLFSHSVNPGDSVDLSPVELSDPIIVETIANPGSTPYPQSTSVRWKLIFHLGCFSGSYSVKNSLD